MTAPPMASPVSPDGPRTVAPAFRRLLRAELGRLVARRFSRVAAVLTVLGYLVTVGLIWHAHGRVSASDIARATAQRDQLIVEFTDQVESCQRAATSDQQRADCGEPPTAEEFPYDQFLRNHPLQPDQLDDYALAVGVATAMLAFLLAATFIGAEWSSKNLIAWLFWEPRRLRVMAAKLIVLLGAVLAVAALAQVVWFATAKVLLHYRGLPVSSLGPQAAHFWSHLVQAQLRAAALALVTALLGFGLASLMRNSAAALGVAFVYFAVVESVVRWLNPDLQPYLLTTNIAAWIAEHGITVYGKEVYNRQQNFVTAKEIHVSNLHGGLTLLVVTALVTAVALAVFARRDLS
jgi:ABC-type transport system involved in multi-copper enzyme maturation permease subunit